MELISSMRDLEENLITLEKYKGSDDYRYVEFYKGLIKRGRCFVAYKNNGQYLFAPSRFIGYKNNSMEKHLANDEKDGRETNPVIDKIIGVQSEPDKSLEGKFRHLCVNLGIEPWRVKRKYWSI
ncbi:MAG: hypothetical protein KAU17_12065 [Spirochaetales bacterium]|nr:hypothetical protein [Spirochaetales bacterium]